MALSWFIWAILYGGIYVVGEVLSNLIGVSHCITAPAIIIYALLLVLYLEKTKNVATPLGIKINLSIKDVVWLLPFLIFPVFNFIALNNEYRVLQIFLFLGVCVVEEIFFRGLLFSALDVRCGSFNACLLSSLIFALFHAVNLFSGFNLLFIIMQVLSSFAIGVSLCAIRLKHRSLMLSAVIHFVINLTGVGGLAIGKVWWAVALVLISLFFVGYGIALIKYTKRQTDNNNNDEN